MNKQENAKDAIKLITDATGYDRTYLAAAWEESDLTVNIIVSGDFCEYVTLIAGVIMDLINDSKIDADEREKIVQYLKDAFDSDELYQYE